jgi:hypothetical protein
MNPHKRFQAPLYTPRWFRNHPHDSDDYIIHHHRVTESFSLLLNFSIVIGEIKGQERKRNHTSNDLMVNQNAIRDKKKFGNKSPI